MPFTLNPALRAETIKLFGPGNNHLRTTHVCERDNLLTEVFCNCAIDPPPKLPLGDVRTRRKDMENIFAIFASLVPQPTDVSCVDLVAKASDGAEIVCKWFTKTDTSSEHPSSSKPGPAYIYAHGGGFIALGLKDTSYIIRRYVSATGVPMLGVEYRLAPEAQAPCQVADMYAGLELLASRAVELGIDPDRIGVMGDSAGGGLATMLAHYVKARPNGPQLAKQILIYPMLDDRTDRVLPTEVEEFLIWSAVDNVTAWDAVLGDRRGKADVKPWEAAARMTVEDAKGLPPAYVEVGELDLFREEVLEYVRKLTAAALSTEFHLIPEVPHGFDSSGPNLPVTQAAFQARYRAILSI